MKEKIKVKRLNRRCNSESAKECTAKGSDNNTSNKNPLVDDQGRAICAVPLVDCKNPGKPVVEGPETSVQMKCSYNQCKLQSKPIHIECFRILEEKMMTILQHLPHRTSRWTTQQMRNNLWDKKGMSLIEKHMRCKCGHGVVVRDEDAWDKAQKQLHAGEEKKRKTTKKRTLPTLGTRSVSESIDFNDDVPVNSLNCKSSQPNSSKYPIGYAPVSDEKENRNEKPNVSSVTEFPPLSEESWQVAGLNRRRGMSFSTAAKASMKPAITIIPSVTQNMISKTPVHNLLSKVTPVSIAHSYPKISPIEPPKFLSTNIIRTSAIEDLSSSNNEWEWDVESDFYECERPAELGNRYRYDETDDWGFTHNFSREGTCDFPRSFGQDSGYRHSGSIPDFDEEFRLSSHRSIDDRDRYRYSNDSVKQGRDYDFGFRWDRFSDVDRDDDRFHPSDELYRRDDLFYRQDDQHRTDLNCKDNSLYHQDESRRSVFSKSDDHYRCSNEMFNFSYEWGEYDLFRGRSTQGIIGRGWSGSDDDNDARFNFRHLRNELERQEPSTGYYSPGW